MSILTVFQSTFFVMLICETIATNTMYNVFLNSYSHCGHDKTFEVTPLKGYIVKADVSPSTQTRLFRDCETNFHSPREDGHLCLAQEGKMNEISDPNAELVVHDGYGRDDDPVIFILKSSNEWKQREYCTESPYINFYLHSVNKSIKVDIRNVYVNLKVLDIESKDRILFLDENYCNGTYNLASSQVSLFNRPYLRSDKSSGTASNTSCKVSFKKAKNESRTICLAYIPAGDHIDCATNWTITIISDQSPGNAANLYQLDCRDNRARQMHSWCGNNKTHLVSMFLTRLTPAASNVSEEPPRMFRFVFADYDGTAERFLDKVIEDLAINASNNEILDTGLIILITLTVIIVIAAVVMLIVCRKKRQLPCVEYKAVHNPENPTPL